MSSAPISIPTATVATSAVSSPTSGLYVPLHKRTGSSASSRSSSTTRSEASAPSQRATSPTSAPAHPLIYSRDALLGLMHSPLARLPLDTRESFRASFPELVTNRRQRKALEYHTHVHLQAQAKAHAQAQAQLQSEGQGQAQYVQNKSHPFVRVQPRRNRPVGRAPERRRNAAKVVDGASWRGRRVVAVPIAV